MAGESPLMRDAQLSLRLPALSTFLTLGCTSSGRYSYDPCLPLLLAPCLYPGPQTHGSAPQHTPDGCRRVSQGARQCLGIT